MDDITIENLSKSYPRLGRAASGYAPGHLALASVRLPDVTLGESILALSNITLRIQAGEIFGILGPAGAGKTTLLRILAGMVRPDSGSICFFGCPMTHQSGDVSLGLVQRLVNPVGLDTRLIEQLSASENLVFSGRITGVPIAEIRLYGAAYLRMLGLDELQAELPVARLSLSARLKVSLARTLLSTNRVLLLDEPLNGMKTTDRQLAWQVLRQCSRERGRTIILATQDPVDVLAICDHVAILEASRVVEAGTPAELLQADLLGEEVQSSCIGCPN
jgi:ABC-type multidrug transport system ATPase subunit